MLGSVISKRWVVSLALVGLVSVFMASYSAVWADPASATTTVASGEVLTTLARTAGLASDEMTANGQNRVFSVQAQNESGGTTLDGTITYMWSISPSNCGSLTGSTTNPSVTFNAGTTGGCTAVISVHAQQNGGGQVDGENSTVRLNAPVVQEVVESDPQPELEESDADLISDFLDTFLESNPGAGTSVVTAANGGSSALPSVDGGFSNGSVNFPTGAFTGHAGVGLTVTSLDTFTFTNSNGEQQEFILSALTEVPAVAASTGGSVPGSFGTDISLYDLDGNKLENFRLAKPAEICLPYTAEDLDSAYGGIDGMAVWHLGESGWVRTNSSVDLNNQVVCGYSSTFSPFIVGLDVAPPETGGETGLPATGDYAPGYGNLMLVLMAGVALVATGGFAIRRSRRVREDS